MTKEYELGLSLLNKIHEHLEALSKVEDRKLAKETVQVIINPIVASAYQIKVGEGPNKDKLLSILFPLIRELRELQDMEKVRALAFELLQTLNGLKEEAPLKEGKG
ncbi:hypothetical protein [Thermocrinis sp.]|uniref:hypothetical protein n=1 Tax=Thermocrinis sp. TaxID=2024383 RepID=UPI002FDE3B18